MNHWEAMAAFLADPATHGGAKTQRIDTHTAAVVMAGDRAWKLRRPVDYGWLDYATRERRRVCAEREIGSVRPRHQTSTHAQLLLVLRVRNFVVAGPRVLYPGARLRGRRRGDRGGGGGDPRERGLLP